MEDIKKAEIFAENEAPEKRWVSLFLRDDGSIQLLTEDTGQTALNTWGKEDYDFSTIIPASAVPLLAFELLRSQFTGRQKATDELAAICKVNDIPYEWDSYP